ncbi:MAG: cysteine-rich CWC family protein [Planctomycetes bacterium]|nr:cysteine-rich CWC family protein [Planctomycetota bacterium]
MSDVRTDRCPLCGGDNACAVAQQGGDPTAVDACWCQTATIPEAAIARIPEPLRGRACVCRRCADAAAGELPAGVTRTTDPGGRDAFELVRGAHRALVSTTGAQVLSWHVDGEDVLWTAGEPAFEPGKPVRGGIPVVFPWFGDHPDDPDKPAHGFARSQTWQLVGAAEAAVSLALRDGDASRALWPQPFSLELDVALAETGELRIAMRVHNPGRAPMTFEQALHTYFAVGDVHEASVHGLEGVPVTEHAREPEGDWDRGAPLRFRAETDRVFQQVPDEIRLRAPALSREVTLRTTDARSAIVWTPWPDKAARLSQMGADDWQTFCCIESANCKENAVTLDPGASHELVLVMSAAQR